MQLGVHTQLLEMRTNVKSSEFRTYITYEGKKNKLMIDKSSCANIIAKTAIEKRLDHIPYPYNVNLVDKTTQPITHHCQIPIHLSNYKDCIWCDVLNIDAARIFWGKPWLYDLDVTSLGKSNTYEFKFKRKKIVLKLVKPKSNVGNNK